MAMARQRELHPPSTPVVCRSGAPWNTGARGHTASFVAVQSLLPKEDMATDVSLDAGGQASNIWKQEEAGVGSRARAEASQPVLATGTKVLQAK